MEKVGGCPPLERREVMWGELAEHPSRFRANTTVLAETTPFIGLRRHIKQFEGDDNV